MAQREHKMQVVSSKFSVGQRIRHRLFDYRGVIVDVDPHFAGHEEWYWVMANSRPPRNRPWYRVLVHDSDYETYVAERNLEPDVHDQPVRHPLLSSYFSDLRNGAYISKKRSN